MCSSNLLDFQFIPSGFALYFEFNAVMSRHHDLYLIHSITLLGCDPGAEYSQFLSDECLIPLICFIAQVFFS